MMASTADSKVLRRVEMSESSPPANKQSNVEWDRLRHSSQHVHVRTTLEKRME